MAMNKRERAAMEALEVRCALRHTDHDPAPDLPVPGRDELPGFQDVRHGWSVYPSRHIGGAVEATWTTTVTHGAGHPDGRPQYRGSRAGIAQYSTRVRALRALRRAVEQKAAEDLRTIDRMITEETDVRSRR